MGNKSVILEANVQIPEYVGFKQEEEIKIKENAFFDGHAYGYEVGRIYDDGEVKSSFVKDHENKTTEMFDKLINDVELITKSTYTVNFETGLERFVTRYYLPYRVKGHSFTLPTVTESHVDNCCNVEYSVAYEILFVADEGYKRYLTVEYETEGSFAMSFWDHMSDVEEMLEEMFENEDNNGFYDHGDYRTVTFYDDVGDVCDIDISSSSLHELLCMIASIRVIRCDHKIIG